MFLITFGIISNIRMCVRVLQTAVDEDVESHLSEVRGERERGTQSYHNIVQGTQL